MNCFLILPALLLVCLSVRSQSVSNVVLTQEGTRFRIEYDLSEQIETTVSVSVDNSRTFSPVYELSGNAGASAVSGHNIVYWDALTEWGEFSHELTVKVATAPLSKVVLANDVPFTMIYVKGGTFVMGTSREKDSDAADNESPHTVQISSYYISQTEVTQELWNAVMDEKRFFFQGENQPVNLVSYNDITAFISRLNLITGLGFNLPTEAEWEYAARGGRKSLGYKYSGSDNPRNVAWFGQKEGEAGSSQKHRVATKQPNELGLYDMSGNMWEWCRDFYGTYPEEEQTDPTGPKEGTHRVVRGGSYLSRPINCRTAFRSANTPESRLIHTGFRLSLPVANIGL